MLLLDVTHPSQGAETISAATAAAFYAAADLGSGEAIEFTITPVAASTSYVGGNYYAIFADNGQRGGIFLVDTHLTIWTSPGDVQSLDQAMTWSAGQAITIKFWNDAGTRKATISGATTGNGTFNLSQTGPFFDSTQDLGVGSFPGSSAYRFNGAISDVTDGQTGTTHNVSVSVTAAADVEVAGSRTHQRAAAVTGAVAAAVAGARTHQRSAAVAAAAAIAIAGLVAGGATTHEVSASVTGAADLEVSGTRTHQRSSSATGAADLEIAARRTHHRSASVTAAAAVAAAGRIGAGFGRGAYDAARVLYGTAAGTVSVTIATPTSGSTILVAVGGNLSDLATAPTDSESNTWTLVGTEEYAQWAGYGIKLYQCIGATGDASHTFSQQYGQTLGFDEATIAVVCVEQAAYVAGSALVERASGSSLVTPSVTSGDTCEWIVFLSGDAPTGATAALTPNNGLTILDDSTGVDHPNGYVPIVILGASKSAGTHSSTIGIVPTQGAIIGAFAVQEANTIGRSADVTGAAAISIAGRVTHQRAASVTGAAAVAVAGAATHQVAGQVVSTASLAVSGQVTRQRAAGVAAAADLEVAGLRTHQRAAAVTGAAELEASGTRAHQRAAAVAAAADLEVAGARVHQRAAAVAGAVDLEVAGLVLPPGATQHEVAAAVAGAVTVSVAGLRTHQRSAAVTAAAAAALAGQRGHQRAVAVTGAASLAIAGSTTTGRTTTIAAIRDAILARIAGLTPALDTANRWTPHDDVEPLRDWATRAPAAAYRRFSVEPGYTTLAPVVSSITLEQVTTPFEVVVAYPLTGRWANRRGLQDVIDSDRRRLEYEVGTASRSGAGFDAPATLISRDLPALEETPEGVVFASLLIDATYWRTPP